MRTISFAVAPSSTPFNGMQRLRPAVLHKVLSQHLDACVVCPKSGRMTLAEEAHSRLRNPTFNAKSTPMATTMCVVLV